MDPAELVAAARALGYAVDRMRCPSCGTENAPDSRFCGGCGARMQSSPLVAPTQNISDDSPYPQSPPQPGPISGQHYQSGPATLPPANQGYPPPSIPPQNNSFGPASVPPQNNTYGTGPASVPPQNNSFGPASVPPQSATPRPSPAVSVRTPSQPTPSVSARAPKANGVARNVTPVPAYSDASLGKPPGRRWGLVITVLVFDLALAGAGIYLLTEGLA